MKIHKLIEEVIDAWGLKECIKEKDVLAGVESAIEEALVKGIQAASVDKSWIDEANDICELCEVHIV